MGLVDTRSSFRSEPAAVPDTATSMLLLPSLILPDPYTFPPSWRRVRASSLVRLSLRVKNQFLTEMDGINGKSKESQLYVIGATNKPWSLEAGFLRRFQKRIYVTLPDQA